MSEEKKWGFFSDKIISRVVDILFSKEKAIERWLFLLIFIGFILRLIAALNLDAFADDPIKAFQAQGIIGSKSISTSSSPALFFYLTDFSYIIFGSSTFASRFWPLIFGTLLIPLSFLITKKFFNEKAALFTAFFVTFSNFLIKTTLTEESLVVLFFVMFGVYFGLEYLDKRNLYFVIFSAIFFGLASLTKYSAPFFILSFLIFSIIYLKIKKEQILTKKNLSSLIFFLIIIFLFSLPFLTFNYLLYKDKGILDIYFSRIIRLESTQRFYGSLAGQDLTFWGNLLNIKNHGNIFLPFKTDPIILIFAVLGMLFMLIKKEKILLLFVLLFLFIPFILQTGGSTLPKHFVFMHFILAIPSGYSLEKIFKKINNLITKKALLLVLAISLLLILVFVKYGAPSSYLTKSALSELKSFVHHNIDESDLILFDPRIYTGRAFWFALPNHNLNFFQFVDFYTINANLSNYSKIPTTVYIVECVIDDCGWGTIIQQPEVNKSAENLLSQLTSEIKPLKDIDMNGRTEYRIYETKMLFNPQLIEQTDYINSFYFVPYLYKNMNNYTFNYKIHSSLDAFLNKLSYYIILLSILLSLISIIIIFYYVIDGKKKIQETF